ncbi:MAG TPA: bifunctional serine/threonine-protein kinase/formylglycine-generating enzyme family protein, partial [Vicinamibacterales bacterium]|nr:bifunctional serine/threonine-protein kinase/formylglycine-generating enzyme family protein [Vicinamibacterales bacterium]
MTTLGVGSRLGRYEVRGKLGAGGMAEVYLAEDTELGRRVAIKLLPADTSADDHARKRLLREARAAATLDHPHICAVYEVGEADGHRFIAMQYVEGESLDVKLKRSALDLKDSITIAAEMADALTEAHVRGIIHRDIKPSNVVITPRGRAIVLDFGLAKIVDDPDSAQAMVETQSVLSGPGAVLGTVPYMSPEQVRGEVLDGRSDIFSLGVTLYEMLSGQRPFADKSSAAIASAILTREPAPIARFVADVPSELERILAKTLRKDVNERYQTAKDLLIDLRTLRDELDFQKRLGRSTSSASVAMSSASGASTAPAPVTPRTARSRTVPMALGALVVLSIAGWFIWKSMNVRWAKAQLPHIEALANANDNARAFALAQPVERYLPGDPTLGSLMHTVSDTISVSTEPAGAQVFLKRFAADPSGALPPRELVGVTPLTNFRVARGEYVLYIEKDGYAPTERTVSGAMLHANGLTVPPPPIRVEQTLIPLDKMPARMVAVPGGEYRLVAWSRPTDTRVTLNDYFIDKYEVTNQEYKDFINAGGYVKKDFWKHPFVRDGKAMSWEDAMKLFVDRTGLPGPRSWSSQNVPEGKADHPVTDVTWYEASAYAQFHGKQLPSVFQWEKAARNGLTESIVNYMPWGVFYPGDPLVHHANFESNGTMPVNSSEFGMSPFGAYNMAGNAQEWTVNDTPEGRIATGGAWGEPTYVFAQYATLPAFYSSNKVGFRCALTTPGAKGDQGAMRIEIAQEIPVYKRSSDEDFAKWSEAYRYDKAPLDARVESTQQTPEWTVEKISFNGDDGERAIGYLYLPNNFARPLQVIHMVPAGDVDQGFRSLPASIEAGLGPIIKSGRAAFGVVLKGYIERLRPPGYVIPDRTSVEYLERIVNRVTDLRRGLDYLETRKEVDSGKVAF